MQIRLNDLSGHLNRSLAPVYLVSGDEPLQRDEALTAIRARARELGFHERIRLTASKGFDWSELRQLADTLSLFADKRLIELELPTGKPGESGAKALLDYVDRINPDNVLVVYASRLDPATRRTRWYKALDGSGICLPVWPVDVERLPRWLSDRAARSGIRLSADAARLLAERVEGNLLAADQELQKLVLIHVNDSTRAHSSIEVDAKMVMESVGESSRYNVFDCVEAALEGNPARTASILQGLREEGVEPILVLWALARELRALARMRRRIDAGVEISRVLQEERVWDNRKRRITGTLNRHGASAFGDFLKRAAHTDKTVKGAARGRPWDELTSIALGLAGLIVPGASAYT